jgi:hypothetical protein
MAWWEMRSLRTAANAMEFVFGSIGWLLKILPEPWNLIAVGVFLLICVIVGITIISYIEGAIHFLKHLR